MRILWVVNIMLPEVALKLGRESTNREGWLTGLIERLRNAITDYEFCIAYPVKEYDVPICTILDNVKCYPFYEDLDHPEYYDSGIEKPIREIIDMTEPDLLHIFGAEFGHAYAFAKVYANPGKTVIGMQGICAQIAKDYMACIPSNVSSSVTLRDFLKKDSLRQQQRKFYLRAYKEAEAVALSGNIIGRTDFDHEAVIRINEEVKYYTVNETMRPGFYEGVWKIENAVKHSIFLGQGDYPIKGMHFVLEACGELIRKYPDLTIKIAGNSIIRHRTLKDKLKTPAYGKYLRKLIKDNHLEKNIVILGSISEERMKEEYLSASVFVCASYVENSPNTLAEAMLLGVPVVTSDAGGIKSMISSDEGYIFERGSVKELTELIDKVWTYQQENSEELLNMCIRSRNRALEEFDGQKNLDTLLDVYNSMLEDAWA